MADIQIWGQSFGYIVMGIGTILFIKVLYYIIIEKQE